MSLPELSVESFDAALRRAEGLLNGGAFREAQELAHKIRGETRKQLGSPVGRQHHGQSIAIEARAFEAEGDLARAAYYFAS